MPKLTRAALLAEAARVRLEAATLTLYADELERAAAKAPLTTGHESATTETQMHVESAGAGRSRGQMDAASLEHPFCKMLVRRGLTVGDVAERMTQVLKRKIARTSLQATYKRPGDAGYRAIKRDLAEALKAEYAVPLSAWARISE